MSLQDKKEPFQEAWQNNTTRLDYSPFYVYLELTNICTRKCSNCTNARLHRPRGYMSLHLAYQALYECVGMNIDWVYLFHLGESTLHPNLEDIIDYAHQVDRKVRLHTNGDVDISSFANKIDALYISVNDGLSRRAKKNVKKLEELKIPFTYSLLEGMTPISYLNKGNAIVKENHGWHNRPNSSKLTFVQSCTQPYKCMCILWDGIVVPCCADDEGEYPVGDFNTKSLREIWNSWHIQCLRNRKVKLPPMCAKCPLKEQGV